MKRVFILLIAIVFIFLTNINELSALSIPDIFISSPEIPQGDLALLRIRARENETPYVIWNDKNIHLIQSPEKAEWTGFLAVDLNEEPGLYSGVARIPSIGWEHWFRIEVIKKDHGIRQLTLPKKMVEPDPEVLDRIKLETKEMETLWQIRGSSPAWRGPFLRPVPGKVIGTFGRKSVINDQPRAPHSGIDLRGAKGSPVKAVNHGMVVLTGNHYFSGRSIVIDHGGELFSMYFHLDEIKVRNGDVIEKGQIIGLVGSSGRATGPHLHFGVRINGARVDPLKLITISKELEE